MNLFASRMENRFCRPYAPNTSQRTSSLWFVYHQQYGIFRLTLARTTKVWTEKLSKYDGRVLPMSEMPNFETETRCENELVEERI